MNASTEKFKQDREASEKHEKELSDQLQSDADSIEDLERYMRETAKKLKEEEELRGKAKGRLKKREIELCEEEAAKDACVLLSRIFRKPRRNSKNNPKERRSREQAQERSGMR